MLLIIIPFSLLSSFFLPHQADMVVLLTVLCFHVECLKLYFLGQRNLEKIHFWTRQNLKQNFPYTELFSSFPLPRYFFPPDYKINTCLMSKNLESRNKVENESLLRDTYQSGRIEQFGHTYFYEYIRLHVMWCMFWS